ncbi:MAG: hypothetical protein JO110_13645 [Acetobacteraceae bacterium]|nr:hypothetical protein [Acetobacteraceae bacterium]
MLLPGGDGPVAGPLLRTEEAWLGAMPEVAEALRPALARLEAQFGASIPIRVAPEGLATFHSHFRATQAEEVWVTLGGWIIAHQPQLSPRVAQRFEAARSLDPAEAAAGRTFRRVVQARFRPLLDGGAILVHPTSPCPAPLLTASPEEQLAIREATIAVTAIAGFCGFPEVSLPVGTVLGAPVGLSLVAGVGRDRALLDFTRRTAELLSLP